MSTETLALIQAISALIVMIATICLAIFTWKYVKITKDILHSNLEINKEILRPYIVIDMPIQDHFIYLRIRNVGKRPAFNLSIEINPDIDEILLQTDDGRRKWMDVNNALKQPSFSPGFEKILLINITSRYLKMRNKERNYNYEFKIEYFDQNNIRYDEKFEIDINALTDEKKMAIFTKKYYLSKIEKHFKEIKETIKKSNK